MAGANYTAIENYEAEESRCDNRDNDCDGETDEPFATIPTQI